jgi:hypothetical protein
VRRKAGKQESVVDRSGTLTEQHKQWKNSTCVDPVQLSIKQHGGAACDGDIIWSLLVRGGSIIGARLVASSSEERREWAHGMNLCSQPLGVPGESDVLVVLSSESQSKTRATCTHSQQSRETRSGGSRFARVEFVRRRNNDIWP